MKKKQRIMIITQGVTPVVKPLLTSQYEIVGLVYAMPRKKKRGLFKAVLATILKKIHSIKKGSLKQVASRHAIPYFELSKQNSDTLVDWAKALMPDLTVVYSMSHLLPETILSLAKFGTINLHPSYLPSYRGPNPWFWFYYDNVRQAGVSVHYLDKGEDTGKIILQKTYDIPVGMTSPKMQKLAIEEIGVPLLLESIDLIFSNDVSPKEQPSVSPTRRARNIREQEHQQLLDWHTWDIEHIYHFLRGTQSWLNALTPPRGCYIGQRWQVVSYERMTPPIHYKLARVYREAEGYVVYCKQGKIKLALHFSFKQFIMRLCT